MSADDPVRPDPRTTAAVRAVAWIAVRLRWLVVPAFIAAAVLATLHMDPFRADSPVLNLIPSDSPALRAQRDAVRLFRAPAGSDVIVVQRDPNGLSVAAQRRVIGRAASVAHGHDPSGASLALPLIDVRGAPASAGDSTTAVTHLVFNGSFTPAERTIAAHGFLHRLNQPGDAPVGITGVTPAQIAQGTLILDRIGIVEVLTVLAAALIVFAVFRAPGAALVTVGSIGVAFPITLWALTELGRITGDRLPQDVEPLVVALLLGVVTDYSVFFLSEFRDRVREGAATAVAGRHAPLAVIPIVFVGGVILSLSLLALRASSLEFFRGLGPALALTVASAMLVSIVFVPALIALLGPVVVWPVRAGDREQDGAPTTGHRIARLAAGKWVAALIGTLCIAGLAFTGWQLRGGHLGVDVISGLPSTSEPQVAAHAAEQRFAPGVLAPVDVVVKSGGGPLPQAGLVKLESELRGRPGYAAVVGAGERPPGMSVPPVETADGRAARIVLIPDNDPLGPAAQDDLEHLQSDMPALLADAGMGGATAEYAGQTALAQSAIDALMGDALTIAGAVLLVNLVLMALFLRAVVTPLCLLAANVLSVAAALGATVWLFQDVLGYPDITYYVPFAAAVLLVSLSSDYNVLVVGKVWSESERMPMRDAIATAAPRASRAIRAAGLSLAASFALVALIPLRPMRELALVMAVGVLIESFVVRSLLAPALLALIGRGRTLRRRSSWPAGSVAEQ